MRHSNRPRRGPGRGRARDASAEAAFERALQGNLFPDQSDTRPRFDPRADRKTLQLCRQVQRALAMALPGDCADELLRDVYVESVEPIGGPGQLAVRVIVPAHCGAPASEVMSRLAAQTPRLRAAVAREISRKRVPNLSFIVLPAVGTDFPIGTDFAPGSEVGGEPEGGNHVD